MIHTRTGAPHTAPAIQVLYCRSVCVLYVLLCVLLLPELVALTRTRCGVELIADLEFVCGDRGFYRSPGHAVRSSGPRSRGKGIVQQCCIKPCTLQHLEQYCAKPKRERRHTGPPMEQVTEDQFWLVFFKQYERNLFRNERHKFIKRLKEQMLYQEMFRNVSAAPLTGRKQRRSSRKHH